MSFLPLIPSMVALQPFLARLELFEFVHAVVLLLLLIIINELLSYPISYLFCIYNCSFVDIADLCNLFFSTCCRSWWLHMLAFHSSFVC